MRQNRTLATNSVDWLGTFLKLAIANFSIDDGDGSENVTFQTLSRLFQFPENVKCRRISLELISWGPRSSFEREGKIRCRLFTCSIKREIRDFHVVASCSDRKEMYKKA